MVERESDQHEEVDLDQPVAVNHPAVRDPARRHRKAEDEDMDRDQKCGDHSARGEKPPPQRFTIFFSRHVQPFSVRKSTKMTKDTTTKAPTFSATNKLRDISRPPIRSGKTMAED